MLWQSFPSSVNVVSLVVDALEWPWSNQTLVVVGVVLSAVVVVIVVVSNSFFSFLYVYLTVSNSWQLHIYFCFLSFFFLLLCMSLFSSSSPSPSSSFSSAPRSLMPITTKHMIITTPAIINQPEKKRRAEVGEVSHCYFDYSSSERLVWIRRGRGACHWCSAKFSDSWELKWSVDCFPFRIMSRKPVSWSWWTSQTSVDACWLKSHSFHLSWSMKIICKSVSGENVLSMNMFDELKYAVRRDFSLAEHLSTMLSFFSRWILIVFLSSRFYSKSDIVCWHLLLYWRAADHIPSLVCSALGWSLFVEKDIESTH